MSLQYSKIAPKNAMLEVGRQDNFIFLDEISDDFSACRGKNMYLKSKKLRAFFLLGVMHSFVFLSSYSYGGVLFEDDFEAQSSTWNIGKGAPQTPSGQTGTWSYLKSNVKTCSELQCGSCERLPRHADNHILYMDNNGGVGGGQALRWVMKRGCSISQYPGSVEWKLPSKSYREVYFGFHLKVDPSWKTTGSEQCKWPFWIALGDSALEGRIWTINHDMTMPASSQIGLFHLTATPNYGWFNTGIRAGDFADGTWHWLEFRIKLNSSSGGSDGVMTAWLDGVKTGTRTGLTFWPSTGSQSDYIYSVRLMLGNCRGSVESWANSDWAGYWIDNFKGGNSYIGPPSGPSASSPPAQLLPPEDLKIVQ
jgi:hypothetical protein